MKKEKKAQVWGLDLIIAVFIFSIGITVFLIYSINYSEEAADTFENLRYDGERIMQTLLLEGSPKDWSESDVARIGILSNNRINETKLERFYNLAQSQYSVSKLLMNTRYDYYFFLDENMEINGKEVAGIGNANFNNSTNIISITRFVIYREKPTTAYLYIWE